MWIISSCWCRKYDCVRHKWRAGGVLFWRSSLDSPCIHVIRSVQNLTVLVERKKIHSYIYTGGSREKCPMGDCLPLTWWTWNERFSTPQARNVCLRRESAFDLYVTLTFDLWPWKPFEQCPLTWWIFMPSLIEILPLGIRSRGITVYGQRTDGWTTENTMPLPLIVYGGSTKIT